jgi:hypothetical protein
VGSRTVHYEWLTELLRYDNARPPLRLDLADPLSIRRATVRRATTEEPGVGPPLISWNVYETQDSPELSMALWSFVKLADPEVSDQRFFKFSARWGPLGICRCGRPLTHASRPVSAEPLGTSCMSPTPLGYDDRSWEPPATRFAWDRRSRSVEDAGWRTRFWEPLSAWRFYASQFAAILAIASRLQWNERISDELWRRAFLWQEFCDPSRLARGDFPPYPEHVREFPDAIAWARGKSAGVLREVLASWAERLLLDARVTPRLVWDLGEVAKVVPSFGQVPPLTHRESETATHADSLYSILASQLIAALANPMGLATCVMCEREYTPARKPRPGERLLCSNPRCKADAQREDKNAWARKNRAAAREHQGRTTPSSTPKPANNGERERTC